MCFFVGFRAHKSGAAGSPPVTFDEEMCQLNSVPNSESNEQVGQLALHRAGSDAELCRDFIVAQAAQHRIDYLAPARAEGPTQDCVCRHRHPSKVHHAARVWE